MQKYITNNLQSHGLKKQHRNMLNSNVIILIINDEKQQQNMAIQFTPFPLVIFIGNFLSLYVCVYVFGCDNNIESMSSWMCYLNEFFILQSNNNIHIQCVFFCMRHGFSHIASMERFHIHHDNTKGKCSKPTFPSSRVPYCLTYSFFLSYSLLRNRFAKLYLNFFFVIMHRAYVLAKEMRKMF